MKLEIVARKIKVEKINKATYLLSLITIPDNKITLEMRKKDLEYLLEQINKVLND